MLKSQAVSQFKSAAQEYTLAKLDKRDTFAAEDKAFKAFYTGKVSIDETKASFLTRELVAKLKKTATINAVINDGVASLALDSVKPRKGENLASVVNLSKTMTGAIADGQICAITIAGIYPERRGALFGVRFGKVISIEKSERKVPDTIREVLRIASLEGNLFSSHETLSELGQLKILKNAQTPLVNSSTENVEEPSESAFSRTFALVKSADTDSRLAYGVVYEPDLVDTDGDSASAAVIEEAAHGYLVDFADINLMHERPLGDRVQVVESYIAPVDFFVGAQRIKRGSWVLVVYVKDDALWQAIREKKLNAFSLEGSGLPI